MQPFIVSSNLNTVGFGILQVDRNKIDYDHFGVYFNGSSYSIDKFSLDLTDTI